MADPLDALLASMEEERQDILGNVQSPAVKNNPIDSSTPGEQRAERKSLRLDNTAYYSAADGDFSWLQQDPDDTTNSTKSESADLNTTLGADDAATTSNVESNLEDELRRLEERQTQIKQLLALKNAATSATKPESSFKDEVQSTTTAKPKPPTLVEVDLFASNTEQQSTAVASETTEKSVVHTRGELSSSDDEDELNRNVGDLSLRQRAIDTGALNRELDATAKRNNATLAVVPSSVGALRAKGVTAGRSLRVGGDDSAAVSTKKGEVLGYFDPFFAIRIRSPLVSSAAFDGLCDGRGKHRLDSLGKTQSQQPQQWATMGIVVEKTNTKTNAKGTQYSMWKLSDLRNDDDTRMLLWLFGDALKKHWKIGVGTAVALLDAAFMEENNTKATSTGKGGKEVKLRIFNAVQLLELGYCPDFGYCKGKRRVDNQPCQNVVNRSRCEYCSFHLLSASKNLASKRGELQYSGNAPPKSFEKRILGDKSQLIYGGMSIGGGTTKNTTGNQRKTAPVTMEQIRTNRNISKVLNDTRRLVVQREGGVMREQIVEENTNKQQQEPRALEKLLEVPSCGSRNMLRQLGGSGVVNEGKSARLGGASFKQVLSAAKAKPHVSAPPLKLNSTCGAPKLGRGLGTNNTIVSLDSTNCSSTVTSTTDRAKQRAIEVVKKVGAVSHKPAKRNRAIDENVPPKAQQTVASKSGILTTTLRNDRSPIKKRTKLGEVELNDERIASLLDKRSEHDWEVEQEEANQEAKYFTLMGAKEQVETRLTSLTELNDCKVVSCKKCAYTWHAQSEYCKQQGHPIRRHTATKRFFKCKQCAKRTIAYTLLPTRPCSECASSDFESVAMRDERKGPTLKQDELKVRGDEIPFANR